jgi:hypothetical protein
MSSSTIVFTSDTMQLLYTNDIKKDILQINISKIRFLINNVTDDRTKKKPTRLLSPLQKGKGFFFTDCFVFCQP